MSSPISTPKGGGAQSGLGEKFSPDLFTGTGNFSVPIALPPGRNGFQPELGLQYSTGSGNSPFGLGWNLSVPGVMRKTVKGVPRYDDEKDTFILSGAEDLVAVLKIEIRDNTQNEAGITPLQNERGFATQYRPRTEGLFARIYHIKTNFRNCWKVMSKDGLVSWYGSKELFQSDLSLVQKPDHAASIFAWNLREGTGKRKQLSPLGPKLSERNKILRLQPHTRQHRLHGEDFIQLRKPQRCFFRLQKRL
jgi:hypothetical protein